jgi:DNA replication protein DnaC
MHGQSCTYAHSETFRRSLFSDDVVDLSGRPLNIRCFQCDVLLLDDLGKEVKSTKSGHELYALEHLVRERYSRNKVTLYTTNMSSKRLKEAYKVSTISVLEGNTMTHKMLGVNKRVGAHSELRDFLKGSK